MKEIIFIDQEGKSENWLNKDDVLELIDSIKCSAQDNAIWFKQQLKTRIKENKSQDCSGMSSRDKNEGSNISNDIPPEIRGVSLAKSVGDEDGNN